jgi:glucan endo-1,3-alpha-glucosidase
VGHTDISLASSKGVDAFALNLGSDSWQPDRVADAFQAAQNSGTDFKLFFSFDMTSLPCSSSNDAGTIRNLISKYGSHPNQLLYDGKPFVSTFSGEGCNFGQGNLNDAWAYTLNVAPVYFVPSFFVDSSTLSTLPVIDGAFPVSRTTSYPKRSDVIVTL